MDKAKLRRGFPDKYGSPIQELVQSEETLDKCGEIPQINARYKKTTSIFSNSAVHNGEE